MAVTDADAIARCRSLWPAVDESAADNAFLEAWLRQARAEVRDGDDDGGRFGDDADIALGHLLAHHAYRVNPKKKLPAQFSITAGEAASVTEGSQSVGARSQSVLFTGNGEDYTKTPPGCAFLALDALISRESSVTVT